MATPSPTSYQALYRACMKEAAAQGRTLMQRVVARALVAMPQRAALSPDVVERNLLAEAARVLMKHEAALCEAYPQALLQEFAHAIAGDGRKASGVSFDSLELMGEEQVQESVEVVRTQQAVLSAVEFELTELSALICAVQGLKTLQPDRNPLRPEVYVRALRTVTQQSPVPPSARRRWLLHLGEAMGAELAFAYQELSAMLRAQGVNEAGFAVVPSNEPSAPATAPKPTPAADAKTLLNVHELKRLLSGEFDPGTAPSAPAADAQPDFSMTLPAAFEALQEMRQVDQVMQRLRQRQAVMPGDPGSGAAAMRDALRQEAKKPGQALGLEVVHQMVENIAQDPRLLAPVQQAVRELEPALLRLALVDPRFFSDKKHPARELLEEMTQRSLAWTSPESQGFSAFMQPLQEAVDALQETRATGAEPFDFALKSLRDAWGDAQRRDRRYREKAVRALLQAEQRNLLADKLARQMRERADLAAAPRFVAQFVTGAWTQAMAQARLLDTSGSPDPDGSMALVGDLLWSVQPALAAAHPARLARLVPTLLEKIRHGLATIDYPAGPTDRFLAQLAEAHQQALRPRTAEPERPAALATRLSREELEAMFGDADASGDAWLAPTEAQQSGFVTHQTEVPQPLFQATQPADGDTQPGAMPPAEAALPDIGLPAGAWVELFADGRWDRWQLTWASPHGTLFLFTHTGGKTQSMTRRLVQKMLSVGALKLVSSQAVVDGALDAVAQEALKNSVDLKL
jgi:hypothetical protein